VVEGDGILDEGDTGGVSGYNNGLCDDDVEAKSHAVGDDDTIEDDSNEVSVESTWFSECIDEEDEDIDAVDVVAIDPDNDSDDEALRSHAINK
jgi:hypothetical protein